MERAAQLALSPDEERQAESERCTSSAVRAHLRTASAARRQQARAA